MERFAERLKAAGGHCLELPRSRLAEETARIAASKESTRFSAWETPLVEEAAGGLTGLERIADDGGELRRALDAAQLGIVEADFALAESGTIGLLSGPGRPRLTSCLPRTLVAILPRERLLASLAEVPHWLRARGALPSALALVSGVSCTGDIGDSLVPGVHGPDALYVLVAD
jgi:L-lactate dehydrogenase complex protein LldG